MNRRLRLGLFAGLATVLCAGAQAHAQPAAERGWEVGAGAAIFTSPFKGADDQVRAVPYVAYTSERLSLTPYGLSYTFADVGPVKLAAVAAPRFRITEPDDSPALAGMAKRKTTLEAGLSATLGSELGDLTLTAQADTLGKHDGAQVSLSYSHGFQFGDLGLQPTAGLAWQSHKLANYYYGVRSDEAAPGRAAYRVGDAWVPSIGLNASYRLTDKIRLVGVTSAEFLPKTVRNSPIVGDRVVATGVAGLIYRF